MAAQVKGSGSGAAGIPNRAREVEPAARATPKRVAVLVPPLGAPARAIRGQAALGRGR